MKKFVTLLLAAFALTAAHAQIVTVDFEGDSWTALIDNPQYNGALIYSGDPYTWTDANTTLSSSCVKADWSAWGYGYGWDHGIAISNYVDATADSYDKQLSVPVSNGSQNFAIAWDNASELAFSDGKAHTVQSIDICNTSYALANIKKNLGTGYFFKVTATGTDAAGNTKDVDIMLAENETAVDNWKTIDLSSLGAVTKIVFTFDGSDKSSYGVSTPKYFALDNVKVDMSESSDDDTVDFEADSWNALIDSPQYNGALIYSADPYTWTDANTTLSSSCVKADWTAWGYGYGWDHGIAISDYVDATADSYDKQLSVPVSNGSKNFAVAWDNLSELSFADGQARIIKSIDVCNTSYALANIKKNLGDGYFFKVIAAGTDADGNEKTVDIMLAENNTAIENWTTIDLSALGAVTKVSFTFDGSDKSSYGVSTPKYFALDNIKVGKPVPSAINVAKTSADATPVAYYSINGKRINAPEKGINIVRMSDGTSKKIVIR